MRLVIIIGKLVIINSNRAKNVPLILIKNSDNNGRLHTITSIIISGDFIVKYPHLTLWGIPHNLCS